MGDVDVIGWISPFFSEALKSTISLHSFPCLSNLLFEAWEFLFEVVHHFVDGPQLLLFAALCHEANPLVLYFSANSWEEGNSPTTQGSLHSIQIVIDHEYNCLR